MCEATGESLWEIPLEIPQQTETEDAEREEAVTEADRTEVDGLRAGDEVGGTGYLFGGMYEGVPFFVCAATRESVWEIPLHTQQPAVEEQEEAAAALVARAEEEAEEAEDYSTTPHVGAEVELAQELEVAGGPQWLRLAGSTLSRAP